MTGRAEDLAAPCADGSSCRDTREEHAEKDRGEGGGGSHIKDWSVDEVTDYLARLLFADAAWNTHKWGRHQAPSRSHLKDELGFKPLQVKRLRLEIVHRGRVEARLPCLRSCSRWRQRMLLPFMRTQRRRLCTGLSTIPCAPRTRRTRRRTRS
jgi:hypothetical protein